MTTFADIALGRASRAALAGDNVFVVTVSLDVDFIAPAGLGSWVVADVSVLRRTGRMVFVQAAIRIGDDVVASARGIFATRRK